MPPPAIHSPTAPRRPITTLEWLEQRWEAWRDIWHVLSPMRFPLAILIIAAPFLLLLQQSQDGLLALIENTPGHLGKTFLFLLFWFGWAFSTFYWARFMSRLPAVAPPPRRHEQLIPADELEEWNRALPHRLGAWVIVLVTFALVAANCALKTRAIVIDVVIVLGGTLLCRLFLPPRLARAMFALIGIGVIISVVASCGRPDWDSFSEVDVKFAASAVIVAIALLLWWAYRRVVRDRRKWVNAVAGWLGFFVVDTEFRRDLTRRHSAPRWVIWMLVGIATVTLVGFGASAYFTISRDTRPLAIALSLSWLVGAGLFLWRDEALPSDTRAFVMIYLAVAWSIFMLSLYSAHTAEWFSSPVIFMAVFALWVFGGTFLLAYPAALTGLPITTAVLVFAALMTLIGNRDNHAVRLGDKPAQAGMPIARAFTEWFAKASAAWHAGKHLGPVPLVIVATAGGASRAGYWTTRLLTDFEQRIPGFHHYLFAISSVSGGSLGAGIYRAMLNRLPDEMNSGWEGLPKPISEQKCSGSITRDNFQACGLDVVQEDFLSPTFLTGLFADLTQRVLPGALLPDRGTALERAWEAATEVDWPAYKPGFSSDFHEFWPAERKTWLPALLINGTSAKTGRRVITSNLAIADDPRCLSQDAMAGAVCNPGSSTFPDAVDFFAWMRREVRFSTAIHNSARFPYIDAGGTLRHGDAPVDRIIDGGYFENFGAGTVFDLVQGLARSGRLSKDQQIALFVIQVSSDPDIEDQAGRDTNLNQPTSLSLGDLLTPPEGFYDTRAGLGTRATRVLKDLTKNLGKDNVVGSYFHFRLYDKSEPMSWALSDAAAKKLYQELPEERNCKLKPSGDTNLAEYCNFVCGAGFRAATDCP